MICQALIGSKVLPAVSAHFGPLEEGIYTNMDLLHMFDEETVDGELLPAYVTLVSFVRDAVFKTHVCLKVGRVGRHKIAQQTFTRFFVRQEER